MCVAASEESWPGGDVNLKYNCLFMSNNRRCVGARPKNSITLEAIVLLWGFSLRPPDRVTAGTSTRYVAETVEPVACMAIPYHGPAMPFDSCIHVE